AYLMSGTVSGPVVLTVVALVVAAAAAAQVLLPASGKAGHLTAVAFAGDALFGTDTSGLASNYILYSGREVLPICGFLGNVSAPALATLQADISRGYV